MKKSIVLGAALLLASAAAFAGDVKFSGMARGGYTFKFEDGDFNGAAWKQPGARLNFHITDADGLWDINMKAVGALDSDDAWKAKLTVNVGKALEANGVDLKGLGLSFNIGNMGNDATLKAYDNASGDDRDNFNLYGTYLTSFNVTYDKLAFRLSVDPVSAKDNTKLDTKKNKPGVAVSAKYADKDLGFAVAAGYAHESAGFSDDGDDANGDPDKKGTDTVRLGKVSDADDAAQRTFENGFVVSGNVDVAKLAGLDFKLGTGAAFGYLTDDDLNGMRVAADVSGGIDAVDGWVEYQYTQLDPDKGDKLDYHYLKGNVNLNFFADKGISLDVYAADTDLENAADYWLAGADVGYKLGGVKYVLQGEVGNDAKHDEVYFFVRPKVTINW